MIRSLAARRWSAGLVALGLVLCTFSALAAAANGTRPISLWKVTDSAGQTLYLAGSMHALKRSDLPLPSAYTKAFEASDKLVEEVNPRSLDPAAVAQQAMKLGRLQDRTLEETVGRRKWKQMQALAGKAGIDLDRYQGLKPWLAAVLIGDTLLLRAGYSGQRGVDMHFAHLAKQRGMPGAGLETVAEQFSFFNDMKSGVQERFLMQTLSEAGSTAKDTAQLHDAWAHGNLTALEKQQQRSFKGFPQVRKRLLDDRNARWLPTLEKCLHSGQICFVVVGVEHMAGPHGLIALLQARGARIRQLHAAARQPAPAGGAHTS